MRKYWMTAVLAMVLPLSACSVPAAGRTEEEGTRLEGELKDAEEAAETEIYVFAAASLRAVMEELVSVYQPSQPNVRVTVNTGSSGKLMIQIKEGFACDIFFPAAQKPMDELEESGRIAAGSRTDLVSNQVVVIAGEGTHTEVTGLSDIGAAESVALAGGSVPVGAYTRTALMELGLLERTDYPEDYSSAQISEALNTVISEQDNVSAALVAVIEGSCEVGTVYYSDTFGHEEELVILEMVGSGLTGEIVYPAARVVNDDADERQARAADDFFCFLCSDEAKCIYEKYYFGTDVDGTTDAVYRGAGF